MRVKLGTRMAADFIYDVAKWLNCLCGDSVSVAVESYGSHEDFESNEGYESYES